MILQIFPDITRFYANLNAERLQRLAWQPGAQDGYFFTYKLRQKRLDEAASQVTPSRDQVDEARFYGAIRPFLEQHHLLWSAPKAAGQH